ncbi:MAG: MazG nucleotide pyrophosphohydrolase domain-containing protein [Oscillospiraceae bacterium]
MINFTSKPRYALDDLIRLVHALRAPGGCPWDAAQTHLSIRRNFLEEAYEACEALDCDDAAMLREELGDVLLQVLFHADIEADRGRMTIDDIADAECRKLIFRHPFLFGGENGQLGRAEKAGKGPENDRRGHGRASPDRSRRHGARRKFRKSCENRLSLEIRRTGAGQTSRGSAGAARGRAGRYEHR